jgi:shikimate kinase
VATIYLVVGVPGVGKSWVCEQLKAKFLYLRHDDYIGRPERDAYLSAILRASEALEKPVLIEAPFSVSQIKEPLERMRRTVVPVFIVEDRKTLAERYMRRENRPIPQGHLTRQDTYQKRATEGGHFQGTSTQALAYLQSL